MRVTFIGGADEVGGGCTLLEAGGGAVLVDAGLRMSVHSGNPVVDLSALEGRSLDAILISHAHIDRVGALPLVHQVFPRTPILTTRPSFGLMRVLLMDAARYGKAPLFSSESVSRLLHQVETVSPGQAVSLAGGEMLATFIPSGHILGACSIMLETPEARVWFTGHCSLDHALCVDGMVVPGQEVQLVISESTCSHLLPADRRDQERRLATVVGEVVAGGGKVLVPAFALGRAQEVILALLQAQQRGEIPAFPVYADGLVRGICSVYQEHLPGRFSGFIPVVASTRGQVLEGPPCAVVSSSGRLTGGASRGYARRLAGGAANTILVNAYRDEESPGRRLWDAALGGLRELPLDGEPTHVACQVRPYWLSTHADLAQLSAVLAQLSPPDVVVLHGDRETLGRVLGPRTRIHVARSGDVLEFAYPTGQRPAGRWNQETVLQEVDRLFGDCPDLYRRGTRPDRREVVLSFHFPSVARRRHGAVLEELARRSGWAIAVNPHVHQEALVLEAESLLPPSWKLLRAPSIHPGERVVVRLGSAPGATSKLQRELASRFRRRTGHRLELQLPGRMERNLASEELSAAFAERGVTVFRCSRKTGSGREWLEVSLISPVVAERHRDLIEQLERSTGWTLRVNAEPNQEAIKQHARELADDWDLEKDPGFFKTGGFVRVRTRRRPPPEVERELSERLFRATGYRLEVACEQRKGA